MKKRSIKKKPKKESIFKIWKAGEQRCCVLISLEGKTYQVDLDEQGEKSIAFILPQLFDDHVIKILKDELPITICEVKK